MPSTVNILVWSGLSNWIPSKLASLKHNIIIELVMCKYCNYPEEITNHILIHCELAKPIWNAIISWWKILVFLVVSVGDILKLSESWPFQAIFYTTLWSIWKSYNDSIFNNSKKQTREISGDLKSISLVSSNGWKHEGRWPP